LSELGYIDWEDRRYVPAALSPNGTGQAAKWRLSDLSFGPYATAESVWSSISTHSGEGTS
jgi:hypothetical protein